jgi:branched-chain amino acid transport system ATP-binding protein
MPISDALLELEALSVDYGHVQAVRDVSMSVHEGEIVALLGANGAGKSSLLRAISGAAGTTRGAIRLKGRRIDGFAPHRVARTGVAHVPEGRRVIGSMSVRDNLELAARSSKRRSRAEVDTQLDEVFTTFPRLAERQRQASGLLSGGEQQMLAIGRGIMAKPILLILDEPSMGLAPIVVDEIYRLLRDRTGTLAGCAILLGEQSAALALSVAGRAYVLGRGNVVFAGSADELDQTRLVSAYLDDADGRPRAAGGGPAASP